MFRLVYFPSTGHRLEVYTVEGSSIADIKVHSPAQVAPPPENRAPPLQAQVQPQYVQHHQSHSQAAVPHHHEPKHEFVDPAIVSVGKKPSMPPPDAVPALPQEAPATPIKPMSSATTAPLPSNTSPFVGVAKERSARKPSAATLAAPFSSIDIADAGEQEDDEATTEAPIARSASISKSRTGKPMDDTPIRARKPEESPAKNAEEAWKRTRRGGKSRRKEVAAQERRLVAEQNSSPETHRKGYVTPKTTKSG